MVLNKTNSGSISKIHGTDYETWPGKLVQLYTTTTEAGGEEYDVIRIRPAASPAQKGGEPKPASKPKLASEPFGEPELDAIWPHEDGDPGPQHPGDRM
jgi:hypothetical protein